MKSITPHEIVEYVEANIPRFHQSRLAKLETLKLEDVLKRKNPYLFKAKNITTASDFVKNILDAFLSSSEEGLFGGFLEELAIFVCEQVFSGRKSLVEGIDLEFERNETKYIVSIKSGPNWGNSDQIKKMRENFRKAKRISGGSVYYTNIVAVNGCCYGKESRPNKGDYLKLCGQQFWSFISGNESLYTEIIEPLGHKAKEKNDQFFNEYSKVVNKFTMEFMQAFCLEGEILWEKIVQFNSSDST